MDGNPFVLTSGLRKNKRILKNVVVEAIWENFDRFFDTPKSSGAIEDNILMFEELTPKQMKSFDGDMYWKVYVDIKKKRVIIWDLLRFDTERDKHLGKKIQKKIVNTKVICKEKADQFILYGILSEFMPRSEN